MSQSADRVPTHIGRFVVESVLGAGGMGAVYKATDPTLKRTVAVKTVRPDISEQSYLQRLVGEAQACARLHHPHIVMVHEAGEIDGGAYVVMEYLEGEDLAQALWRGELSFEARVKMLIQILEALDHAHANGVIHRDIKPANIRVLANGNIKIVDFGLARMTMVDARTVTGTIMGTLHYASPEQLRGEKVDGRTDIYSTGTMAYEMLSGRKPFDGDTISTIILKVIQDPVPPMDAQWSRNFPEIEKIISRAMAKNAADRYQSAEDMKNALTAFLASARERIASASAHDTVVVQQTLIGAQTLMREGKDSDARALLEETLKRHPHSPGVRETLATLPPAADDATVVRMPSVRSAPPLQQSTPSGPASAGTWGAAPGPATATFGGQSPAPPVPKPQPAPRPWLVPAAALVALSVIGGASYMMMNGGSPAPETTIAAADPGGAPPVVPPAEPPPTNPAAPATNTATTPATTPAAVPAPVSNPPADLVPKSTAAPTAKTDPPKPTPNVATPATNGGAVPAVVPVVAAADKMFTDAPNTGLRYRVSRVARTGTETDIDPATTTFRSGDRVRLSFESNVDGYLYLVQQGSSGRWSVLFPNPEINGGRNRVRKSAEYQVPDEDGFFEFDANPGVENLFVYFSQEPMQELPGFGNKPVTKPETLTASAVSQLQGTIASRDLSFGRDPKPATKSGNIIQANYVVNKSELGKAVSASFTLKHEP
jgi:serine/threonine protein kinase